MILFIFNLFTTMINFYPSIYQLIPFKIEQGENKDLIKQLK